MTRIALAAAALGALATPAAAHLTGTAPHDALHAGQAALIGAVLILGAALAARPLAARILRRRQDEETPR